MLARPVDTVAARTPRRPRRSRYYAFECSARALVEPCLLSEWCAHVFALLCTPLKHVNRVQMSDALERTSSTESMLEGERHDAMDRLSRSNLADVDYAIWDTTAGATDRCATIHGYLCLPTTQHTATYVHNLLVHARTVPPNSTLTVTSLAVNCRHAQFAHYVAELRAATAPAFIFERGTLPQATLKGVRGASEPPANTHATRSSSTDTCVNAAASTVPLAITLNNRVPMEESTLDKVQTRTAANISLDDAILTPPIPPMEWETRLAQLEHDAATTRDQLSLLHDLVNNNATQCAHLAADVQAVCRELEYDASTGHAVRVRALNAHLQLVITTAEYLTNRTNVIWHTCAEAQRCTHTLYDEDRAPRVKAHARAVGARYDVFAAPSTGSSTESSVVSSILKDGCVPRNRTARGRTDCERSAGTHAERTSVNTVHRYESATFVRNSETALTSAAHSCPSSTDSDMDVSQITRIANKKRKLDVS